MRYKNGVMVVGFALGMASSLFGQGATTQQLSQEQMVEKTAQSVAVIVARRTSTDPIGTKGAGIVVRQNGILLTPYSLIKDAQYVQVRFKSGEIFEQVQLLGVDQRRDVAAIKITAAALSAPPIAISAQTTNAEAVGVISHPDGLPWSLAAGVVGSVRLADEIPGAGSGYKAVEFTVTSPQSANGGVLVDSRGYALALVVRPINGGQNSNFAVPIDNVLGLADSPITRVFATSNFALPVAATSPSPVRRPSVGDSIAVPNAPEKSDVLSTSKDRDFILRNFKTMYVNASRAKYFESDQLKAELGRNKEFAKLNIQIVDDPRIADTVLEVGYTFAWDYPFELKHQNTTIVLLSGKGLGPFSGIAGATNVAEELAKAAKPHRTAPKK